MQAWQQVQVSNAESAHQGKAGYVVRVETVDSKPIVRVKLDTEPDVLSFDASELRIL